MPISNHEIEELLPAYVNGTLNKDQQGAVEAYLAEHPDARAEVEWLRELRRGMCKLSQENSPGELGWHRLRRSLQKENTAASTHNTAWWKPAMAAAALVVVLQITLLISFNPGNDVFRPLSGSVDAGQIVQVKFRSTASEAQIRELLLRVDGQIVEGPSAIGLYRVRIGNDDSSTATVKQALEVLHGSKEVVSHAAAE